MLLCVALTACHRDIRNENAVKQGVMDYLSTRQGLNMASMNVAVQSMVFRQNEVDATVVFSPKGSGPAQPMSLRYTLERQGERWVVKPRATGGNPHGGAGSSPHGEMGMPPANGGAGQLPAGHPALPPDSAPK